MQGGAIQALGYALTEEIVIEGGQMLNPNLALYTMELEPQFNPQNQVVGFLGVGGNDSGQNSTFTVHVLCYTP
jgi:hypothetical protein